MSKELQYDKYMHDFMFRRGASNDFLSPASQEILMHWKRQGWEPTNGSRDRYAPFFTRRDPLRSTTYYNTASVVQHTSFNTSHGSVALPSGQLHLGPVEYPSEVLTDDSELYHYEAQRIFCIFSQFDTLTEDQLVSLSSATPERVREICNMFHAHGLLRRVDELDDLIGRIWILDRFSMHTYTYQEGMDTLYQLFSFGNHNMKDNVPPGSGSNSTIKHNLQTAETLLRVAEAGDLVAGIWGDLFASESLFHDQLENVEHRRNHGDGVIVTKDGTVIVLEMVGSSISSPNAYNSIVEKAAAWVGIIANSEVDLHVLFIDGVWMRNKDYLLISLDRAIRTESKRFTANEYQRQRAATHIGLANLTNWFPDYSVVSRAASRLVAWCPAMRKARAFDVPDEKFSTPEIREAIVMNSALAMHTPMWMRGEIHERDLQRDYAFDYA